MSFNAGYIFGMNNLIVIQHKGGKFLRVKPNDLHCADSNGGKGAFAQWNVELANGLFKFRSAKTGKYLRITQNGAIDVGGTGGPWTLFKAHGSGNCRKLESYKLPGKYIAVRNGQVVYGTGGPFCVLNFYRNQQQQKFQQQNFQQNFQQQHFQPQQQHTTTIITTHTNTNTNFHQQKQHHKDPFTTQFLFGMTQLVVMKHTGGKYLRIDPQHHEHLDCNGGKGPFAQWKAEKHSGGFKFKNWKSGKYMRVNKHGQCDVEGKGGDRCLFKIHGSGNTRKLEASKDHGKYVAVRNGRVCIGNGGPYCALTFFRE